MISYMKQTRHWSISTAAVNLRWRTSYHPLCLSGREKRIRLSSLLMVVGEHSVCLVVSLFYRSELNHMRFVCHCLVLIILLSLWSFLWAKKNGVFKLWNIGWIQSQEVKFWAHMLKNKIQARTCCSFDVRIVWAMRDEDRIWESVLADVSGCLLTIKNSCCVRLRVDLSVLLRARKTRAALHRNHPETHWQYN